MTYGDSSPPGANASPSRPRLPRRRVLLGLGAGAIAALGAGSVLGREPAERAAARHPWHASEVWGGGRPPRPGETGLLRGHAVLAGDAEVGALRIAPGASLTFAGDRDATLTSHGNVVVEGGLRLAPARADVVHRLRFQGVDEARVRGGGREVLAADVGLWVMGAGELVLRGTRRRSWTRLAGGVTAGTLVLELAGEPDGWRPGDELVVVPTARPSQPAHHQGYDRATVRRVDGGVVHLTAPLRHDHPAVEAGGVVLTAEVLNLSRNVVVGGTGEGRAHVLLHTTVPPRLAYARVEHAGPQREQGLAGEDGRAVATPVLGRYGLHFHHCGDALRGTEVEGVVVTSCGNHAFVAHDSHGIRFLDCAAHDTTLSAFWWDSDTAEEATHETVYERCVASRTAGVDVAVTAASAALTQRIGGFELLRGRANTAVDCVAVGGQGGRDSAGFLWPEEAEGVWEMRGCVSHNHRHHGSYVWQNTSQPHEVERLVAYHNGGHGIVHGAYSNNYAYRNCVSYGNAGAAVLRQANSAGPEARQEWHACRFDAAGEGAHALVNGPHAYPPSREAGDVLFQECEFVGAGVAAVALFDASDIRSWCALDFVDCRFDEPRFEVAAAYEGTRWRVQSGGEAAEIHWSRDAGEQPVAPFERSY